MVRFLASRWFLLCLAAALVGGIAAAPALQPVAELPRLGDAVLFTSLFLMALPVASRALWQTLLRPLGPLIAVAMSTAFIPLAAWGASLALTREMALGLLVAATTPCTLASAAVWTRRAGGNDALAVLVTIVTNLACFLTIPFWLALTTGRTLGAHTLQPLDLIVELGLLVVLPIVLAQLARRQPLVREFANRRKHALGVASQLGILSMVLLGSIRTGLRLRDAGADALAPLDVLAMLAAVLGVHLAALFAGMFVARRLGLPRAEQIAVAFAGSQKTLMVGLKVCLDLHISILPMVAFHVGQLFVDTLIADRLAHGSEPRDAAGAPQSSAPEP